MQAVVFVRQAEETQRHKHRDMLCVYVYVAGSAGENYVVA